jgi:predicted 3-demethylubiquinone-9 3-methyltransferase (glyoxalase superfamily)
VSWQIVPTILFDLLKDTDRAKVEGVTKAMLGMKKLNINALTRA